MSRSDTAQKPEKANIQGGEIHCVKINNNERKAKLDSLGKRQSKGSSALPADPDKGRIDM